MLIIEIRLIPDAVFIAFLKEKFCLTSIIVSRAILVISPFIIAKIIMPNNGKEI